VLSCMLHRRETWSVRKENEVALQRAEMSMVRWMCNVKVKDRVPSKELRERLGRDDTRKPRKGAAVIAASMHGFANCWKFKSPVTLTLDQVKVTSTYTVRVGLTACPTV